LNPKKGSLELGDTPKDIENLRKDMKNQKVQFLVSWNTRKDNKVPLPTWLTDQELRDAAPKVLCDFLMRKIKWPSKKPK
jgi:reverse gyrase